MDLSQLMNIPRPFTALAEWSACMVYIIMLPKKIKGIKLIFSSIGLLGLFLFLHQVAEMLPLYLWFPGMMGAVMLIYFCIYSSCEVPAIDVGLLCVRAFVVAEFAASFQRQLYVWWALRTQNQSWILSSAVMLVAYLFLYTIYYLIEKKNVPNRKGIEVEKRELVDASLIGIGVFLISNISFVMPNTPFSSDINSLMYVRTLVNLGGLILLFAQQTRWKELWVRSENHALNAVLQRQYDQYRIAIDNMELLRRESHDLKHYMIAIRAEQDPQKREQYLLEMEKAIHTQESFANTGNKVLDVVITTKNSYCTQSNIAFTYIADGKLISFMHVKDICSVFGNALDNAIECVSQFDDLEKRTIHLSISRKSGFIIILCENYIEQHLTITDSSLPDTTKSNKRYHGYGLKSIQAAVQKYAGTMTISTNDNWFGLKILIPVQE